MRCPFCGYGDTAVKDSRAVEENTAVRRRRHCLECNARFSTVEHVQLVPLKIIKRDMSLEPFMREKLIHSFNTALHKRAISSEKIERVVNSIIRQLETLGESEISSTTLGSMVMETLKELDVAAYIRYASVYENFHDLEDFQHMVNEAKKETKHKDT